MERAKATDFRKPRRGLWRKHAEIKVASVDWRGCVRRTINLICALALLVVGAYWFVDLPLYAFHPEGIIVVGLGAAAATFLGLYFLIRGRGNRAAKT
jgi:hypothetical protein